MNNIAEIREEFRLWVQHAAELEFLDFISPEDGFATEILSGTIWTNASSTGIYTWVTENGQAYVGQAVNVRNRLRQHWKNYRDIAYAAFQIVPETSLDAFEVRLVKKMEAKFPVLNIKLAQSSAKLVPFDRVIDSTSAEEFLRGKSIAKSVIWQKWPLLENKQLRKFSSFRGKAVYPSTLTALRTYIELCIPFPSATEVKFWSATLLHSNSLLVRINVGQQEVFTLHIYENEIVATIFARRQLDDSGQKPQYETRSIAHTVFADDLETWLTKMRIVECRELVVWLMRHTVPMNSGSHCPQLVRATFAN